MKIDESREFIPVRIAVLTVSDTRTPEDDRSGDTLVERLEGAGHIAGVGSAPAPRANLPSFARRAAPHRSVGTSRTGRQRRRNAISG